MNSTPIRANACTRVLTAIAMLAVLLACGSAIAQQQDSIIWSTPKQPLWDWEYRIEPLPETGISGTLPKLRESYDPHLQRALERGLDDLDLLVHVWLDKLAVALVDITVPDAPRVAEVNGDDMFYAASLPKIGILLGAFQRASEGAMELDEETMDQLTRMIRQSSNEAATTMLNRVGKSYLAELLQSEPYKLYAPEFNGGIWIGKEYSKQRYWKRDPMYNLSHSATAMQAARFYYMMENGRLVSPEYSDKMKAIMGDPAIHHKFVKGLEQERPGSKIFRKSGSWRQYHADSAIVERDGRRYIAVALCEDPRGSEMMSRLIVKLDEIVFDPANVASTNTRKSGHLAAAR